ASENRRREADGVQAVQLLRDPCKGWRELVGLFQFEIPTAGLLGNLFQRSIRRRPHHSLAVEVDRLQSDGVDHDFFLPRVVEDRAEPRLAVSIVTIREDQDDLAPLYRLEHVNALVD